jgi:hypothetical protein
MKSITDLIVFPFKFNSNPTFYPIFKPNKLISNYSNYFSKIADEGNINTNHSILPKQVLIIYQKANHIIQSDHLLYRQRRRFDGRCFRRSGIAGRPSWVGKHGLYLRLQRNFD